MTRFDFHIHTGLSACAEKSMTPSQVVARAKLAGLNLMAITDHNASANVKLAMSAGEELGIKVVPGIEASSREDIHFIALFDRYDELADFQDFLDGELPEGKNPEEIFGYQLIYDSEDEIVDVDERLRQAGTNLESSKLVEEIKKRNGLAIPAHVFRTKFSLTSQLGFIDPGAGYDALEVNPRDWIGRKYLPGVKIEGYPVITASDSHFIEGVGRFCMEIEENADSPAEILRILREKHL